MISYLLRFCDLFIDIYQKVSFIALKIKFWRVFLLKKTKIRILFFIYLNKKRSPLNDLIVEMFPWVLLSEIFVDFLPRYPQSSLHITTIIISILNLASNINDVILIPRVTVSVIISTVFNCFPNLRLCRCLIGSSDVLQSFEASHVRKILFYFRSLNVTIQEHVSNNF